MRTKVWTNISRAEDAGFVEGKQYSTLWIFFIVSVGKATLKRGLAHGKPLIGQGTWYFTWTERKKERKGP